ncbi:hypothetical protein BDZ97DRAFT_1917549 [Flammula alnicola]|nr:hypothetical protein BDZ97DRAFT_1917549 [Flammula alnicola]
MAAPIPVPPPLQSGFRISAVTLQPPSNPPTTTDVANAARYAHSIVSCYIASSRSVITDDEVSAAFEYQAAVIAAKNLTTAPQWFQVAKSQVHARLDALEARVGGLETRIGGLESRSDGIEAQVGGLKAWVGGLEARVGGLDTQFDGLEVGTEGLEQRLAKVDRTSSIAYNMQVGTGAVVPFQEVPFPDGSYPTKDPHNLPPINSSADFQSMSSHALKEYHQNYCPDREGVDGILENSVRIREVTTAIGCDAVE